MAFNGKRQLTRGGECIACGVNVRWERVGGGQWLLFDKNGPERHECLKRREPEPEPNTEPTPDPELTAALATLDRRLDDVAVTIGVIGADVAALKAAPKNSGEYRFDTLPPAGKIAKTDGHAAMPKLLRCLAADQPAFIWGPPGTGKTEGARLAAKALSQGFTETVLGPADTPARILGYRNPMTDAYVETDFIRAFRDGHVILIDEVCIAAPAVLTVLNPAFGGVGCSLSTPGGSIPRHPNTRLIIADNTDGLGRDVAFPTRRALDISFRSRFSCIAWTEDCDLTMAVVRQLLRDRSSEAPALMVEFRKAQQADTTMMPRTVTLRLAYAAARLMACDPALTVSSAFEEAR